MRVSNVETKSCRLSFAIPVVLLILAAGCGSQEQGFALPPGDAIRGKATFISLGCTQCHSVANEVELHPLGDAEAHFEIGGYVTKVGTYGDLVTSIINPSHKISRSRTMADHVETGGDSTMIEINRVMTVQELIDITTFLKDAYQVVPPRYYIPQQTGI